ncbi:MAG: hypothetical protein LBN28_02210 [Desulfovibrio sp.]|jgi:hypothetical protein|nr:hypothetical protein [Desulfovibrio sp.]
MNSARNLCWWVLFISAAVALQAFVPGLDVLVAGLLILLQERDYKNMFWLLPLFISIQEGMGTRFFGGTVVWYAMVIVLFKLGQWLFEVESFIFVFLLSACLAVPCYTIDWLMAPLQNLTFNIQETLDKSLVQALFLPVAWRVLSMTRQWIRTDNDVEK